MNRLAPEPAIVQYWHSERPPAEVVAALASFAELNPGMRHMVFNEAKAAEFIGEHFSARELSAFQSCAIPAMQADYFRYCAVYVLGGIYADADFECHAGLGPLLDSGRSGLLFGREPDRITAVFNWPHPVGRFGAVSNGLFAFREPRNELLATAIQIATANIERRVADGPHGVWLSAGPGVFTALYLLRELGSADAFVRYSAGTVLEPSARLCCEIAEHPVAVSALFEGVEILPLAACGAWVRQLDLPRPESGPEAYWPHLTGTIYR